MALIALVSFLRFPVRKFLLMCYEKKSRRRGKVLPNVTELSSGDSAKKKDAETEIEKLAQYYEFWRVKGKGKKKSVNDVQDSSTPALPATEFNEELLRSLLARTTSPYGILAVMYLLENRELLLRAHERDLTNLREEIAKLEAKIQGLQSR
eukprot:g7588.t1